MTTIEINRPVQYKDFYIRLLLAILASHIIIVYGEPESTFEILLTKDYYTAFAGSFIIAMLLIQYVNWITRVLDRRADWVHKAVARAFSQLFLGLIAPGFLAFLFAFTYFKIRGIDILTTSYVTYDFPFIMLMLALINAYYLAYYFYLKWSIAEEIVAKAIVPEAASEFIEQETGEEVFTVSRGSISIPIDASSIGYFFRDGEVNFLRTTEAEDIFTNQSLDEVETQLGERSFFRLNRQMISSFRSVKDYRAIAHGKLEITLDPPFSEPVIVSQKRAKSFKQWMDFNRYNSKNSGQ